MRVGHKKKLKNHEINNIPGQIFMSRQTSTVTKNNQKQDSASANMVSNFNFFQPVLSKITDSLMIRTKKVPNVILYDQISQCQLKFTDFEIITNDKDELILTDLINDLKRNNGPLIERSFISIYNKTLTQQLDQNTQNKNNENLKIYTYCGQDPLPDNFLVKIDLNSDIEIKIRSTKQTIVEQLLIEQNIEKDPQLNQDNKSLRVKERKISEVIQKVALWRRFYTGFYDENMKLIQMPLNEAANKVNISKKTLDDYLLQIRCGKRYGFDFNGYQNERIGKLRTHVKKKKIKVQI